MHTLANLQQALQNHLLKEDESIIQQLIWPVNGLLNDRLDVYANAYCWRLIDALQKEYGLLHTYLGDAQFSELAEAYIDEYPSHFYSISEFTKRLPLFLREYYPNQAYLSELAELIRALSLSLEAADASLLKPSDLAKFSMQNWPSLCFSYHPCVQCLSFQWNTFTFWKALVRKTVLPTLRKEGSYCIVWRKELQSYANRLTTAEFIVFQSLRSGACFADACEAVCASGLVKETEAATFLANCVSCWLNDHWFSEVYIP